MINEKLVKHKQQMKKKQPKFVRQEYNKRKQLPLNWRKPRGVHSKLRLRRRGKPQMVSAGYKMPEQVRGLTREGLLQIFVSAPEHLKFVKAGEVAVIRKVSNKRRLEILQAAQKLNIKILNFKNISKKINEIKAKLGSKQAARKKKEEKRTKKAAEAKKKAKMSVKAKEKEKLETKVKEPKEDKTEEKETKKPEKSIEKIVEKEEKPAEKKPEPKKLPVTSPEPPAKELIAYSSQLTAKEEKPKPKAEPKKPVEKEAKPEKKPEPKLKKKEEKKEVKPAKKEIKKEVKKIKKKETKPKNEVKEK